MNAESFRQAVEHAGVAALLVSFLTGFLFSFNPVALAAIPVSLAYVTEARAPRQASVFGAMFIAGMVLTHELLGAVAGLGGKGVESLLGRFWACCWVPG